MIRYFLRLLVFLLVGVNVFAACFLDSGISFFCTNINNKQRALKSFATVFVFLFDMTIEGERLAEEENSFSWLLGDHRCREKEG